MTAGFIIRVILEVVAVLALAIGFMHEDKVVAFEDRVLEKIRARRARKNVASAGKESAASSSRISSRAESGRETEKKFAQRNTALSPEERESRAREAAYCRNQAAAMRAREARKKAERRVNSLAPQNNSHVA